jgi:hypothetical protein
MAVAIKEYYSPTNTLFGYGIQIQGSQPFSSGDTNKNLLEAKNQHENNEENSID